MQFNKSLLNHIPDEVILHIKMLGYGMIQRVLYQLYETLVIIEHGGGTNFLSLISSSTFHIHKACTIETMMAMYSTLVEDRAMIFHFLEDHVTRPEPRLK